MEIYAAVLSSLQYAQLLWKKRCNSLEKYSLNETDGVPAERDVNGCESPKRMCQSV